MNKPTTHYVPLDSGAENRDTPCRRYKALKIGASMLLFAFLLLGFACDDDHSNVRGTSSGHEGGNGHHDHWDPPAWWPYGDPVNATEEHQRYSESKHAHHHDDGGHGHHDNWNPPVWWPFGDPVNVTEHNLRGSESSNGHHEHWEPPTWWPFGDAVVKPEDKEMI
jgi:hypothetical protein